MFRMWTEGRFGELDQVSNDLTCSQVLANCRPEGPKGLPAVGILPTEYVDPNSSPIKCT